MKTRNDFKTLYRKTAPLLFYVAGQLGVPLDERDDIVQQAYLKLLENEADGEIENAKAYLVCTIRTLVIDRSRRRATRKTETTDSWDRIPEQSLWTNDSAHQAAVEAIGQELDALAASGEAEPLVLFYRKGMSVEQIRAKTGGATGTVTAKLCRLRQKYAPRLRESVERSLAALPVR